MCYQLSQQWDFLWDVVMRQTAQDLLVPDADRFKILRRLEEWAQKYRRALCDPIKLFASLQTQDVVARHVAGLELHCMKKESPDVATMSPCDHSPHWLVMLTNAPLFFGWPIRATRDRMISDWRPASNLYYNPHVFYAPERLHLWGTTTQRLVLMAALADVHRFLTEEEKTNDLVDYETEVLNGTLWVDVESVLLCHCGYPEWTCESKYAEWRQPIRQTEEAFRSFLLSSTDRPLVVHWMVRWLTEKVGCPADLYVWVRYPPSFVSLICDIFGHTCSFSFPSLLRPVIHKSVLQSEMHPLQSYSIWARFGLFGGEPDWIDHSFLSNPAEMHKP